MPEIANTQGFGALVLQEWKLSTAELGKLTRLTATPPTPNYAAEGAIRINITTNVNETFEGNTYRPIQGSVRISPIQTELDAVSSLRMVYAADTIDSSLFNNPAPWIEIRTIFIPTQMYQRKISTWLGWTKEHRGIVNNLRPEGLVATFDVTPQILNIDAGTPKMWSHDSQTMRHRGDNFFKHMARLARGKTTYFPFRGPR